MTDGTSTPVDIELANSSLIIGTTTGIGILVNRARVDYQMPGFSPPPADYPLNLYLSPPADGNPTTGLLTAFPLASTSLKQWLIDSGVGGSVVELTARVTFYGRTDEGGNVETEAGISIALTNTGDTTGATKPTLTIKKARDVKRTTPGATGAFTVYRSSNFSVDLAIEFTPSGTPTAGVNYTHTAPVVIPTSSNYVEIIITPQGADDAAGATGTVRITLNSNPAYHVGSPSYATLEITL